MSDQTLNSCLPSGMHWPNTNLNPRQHCFLKNTKRKQITLGIIRLLKPHYIWRVLIKGKRAQLSAAQTHEFPAVFGPLPSRRSVPIQSITIIIHHRLTLKKAKSASRCGCCFNRKWYTPKKKKRKIELPDEVSVWRYNVLTQRRWPRNSCSYSSTSLLCLAAFKYDWCHFFFFFTSRATRESWRGQKDEKRRRSGISAQSVEVIKR